MLGNFCCSIPAWSGSVRIPFITPAKYSPLQRRPAARARWPRSADLLPTQRGPPVGTCILRLRTAVTRNTLLLANSIDSMHVAASRCVSRGRGRRGTLPAAVPLASRHLPGMCSHCWAGCKTKMWCSSPPLRSSMLPDSREQLLPVDRRLASHGTSSFTTRSTAVLLAISPLNSAACNGCSGSCKQPLPLQSLTCSTFIQPPQNWQRSTTAWESVQFQNFPIRHRSLGTCGLLRHAAILKGKRFESPSWAIADRKRIPIYWLRLLPLHRGIHAWQAASSLPCSLIWVFRPTRPCLNTPPCGLHSML